MMNRQQMIEQMEWLTPDSGTGFGICSVGNSFLWAMQEPSKAQPDLKSIVAIKGPTIKYTDGEITALFEFSQRQTARYDELFRYRLGANMIIIDKTDWGWLRKRMSWDMGEMYSKTLDDALAVFS